MEAPWIKTFTVFDNDTYIFPNRKQVTVGGSRWLGNSSLAVDPHESASIWEKAVRVEPSLRRARVLDQWVGLRPFRCPVRVELERVPVPGGRDLTVSGRADRASNKGSYHARLAK